MFRKMFGKLMSFLVPEPPKLREQTRDYILMMLGAPVVVVELDNEQVDFAVSVAIEKLSHVNWRLRGQQYRNTVYEYSLAHAKLMLGRIRGKWPSVPGPGGSVILDGPTLIAEAREEMKRIEVKYGL